MTTNADLEKQHLRGLIQRELAVQEVEVLTIIQNDLFVLHHQETSLEKMKERQEQEEMTLLADLTEIIQKDHQAEEGAGP